MCWNSAMRITPFLHCAWLAAALLLAAPAARAYDEGGSADGADAFLARPSGSRSGTNERPPRSIWVSERKCGWYQNVPGISAVNS